MQFLKRHTNRSIKRYSLYDDLYDKKYVFFFLKLPICLSIFKNIGNTKKADIKLNF